MRMKNMRLQVKKLISYSAVYPDRHNKIEDLLANIPSNTAIEVISYNLAQKTNLLIGESELKIWVPWVMKTRNDVKTPLICFIQHIRLEEYVLIDEYAMLLLISKLLTYYNDRNEELTEDNISDLLLAYMLCCDERLEPNKALPNNELSADEFVKAYMPFYLKRDSLLSIRDYRLLLIKCYMLMIEFPKNNAIFARYVEEFCKEKGIPNAKKYLDEIFLTFINMGNVDLSNCKIGFSENSAAIQFFDSLSINPGNYKHDSDFLMMREKPIIKTGHNIYNIMYMRMFLDKAYTGLLFDMKEVLVKHGLLDKNNGYANLKALLGVKFSERFFFYTLMKRCFGNQYVHISGEELENTLGQGMPDYYLRKGNSIFLFECKDAQVAASKKLSGDYDIIKNAMFDKYVASSNEKKKGVSQLASVITDKLNLILKQKDTDAPKSYMFVFPIIVYFDDCFDVEGPNYLLNMEFLRLLGNRTTRKDCEVKDLIMVNIEQMMRLENCFADNKLDLAYLINSYIDYKEQAVLNQVFPFNKFLFQEAKRVGYDLKKTRWFDEIYDNLKILDKMEESATSEDQEAGN